MKKLLFLPALIVIFSSCQKDSLSDFDKILQNDTLVKNSDTVLLVKKIKKFYVPQGVSYIGEKDTTIIEFTYKNGIPDSFYTAHSGNPKRGQKWVPLSNSGEKFYYYDAEGNLTMYVSKKNVSGRSVSDTMKWRWSNGNLIQEWVSVENYSQKIGYYRVRYIRREFFYDLSRINTLKSTPAGVGQEMRSRNVCVIEQMHSFEIPGVGGNGEDRKTVILTTFDAEGRISQRILKKEGVDEGLYYEKFEYVK